MWDSAFVRMNPVRVDRFWSVCPGEAAGAVYLPLLVDVQTIESKAPPKPTAVRAAGHPGARVGSSARSQHHWPLWRWPTVTVILGLGSRPGLGRRSFPRSPKSHRDSASSSRPPASPVCRHVSNRSCPSPQSAGGKGGSDLDRTGWRSVAAKLRW
jgi:hypothetical protein